MLNRPEILVICPEIGIMNPMKAWTYPERNLGAVLVKREVAEKIVPLMNANREPDSLLDVLYWDAEGELVWTADGLVAGPDDDGLFNLSCDNFVLWSEVL